MNFADIFYPENPKMRETLIRKSQEIVELMKNNFRATNQLIDVLKEHLGLRFNPITLNESATVKANCDVLIQRIREIQTRLEKIDKELVEKLEPDLYEKLKTRDLSIPERAKVSEVLRGIQCGFAGLVAPFVVGWLFQNVAILAGITVTCELIATGLLGCVVFGVLLMGIEMIFQGILGSIERDRLKQALKEYEDALEDFRPASEKYQDSITEVKLTIKRMANMNELS
ncbi:single-pass membrane and coiled-coil domain-containing protein 3-like isoform X2 [Misgurnus anguillicaudatus]|uniref:single-pass membrane and coiled-coil domain-containing protein 3-like isoform X2 n=1 Tax=Misgurnus anguillicaudatus TaxID=75329 RepID=UPI003CCF4CD4